MRWLWFIGPLMVLGSYLSVVLGGTTEDVRRKLYLNRWVDEFLGALLDRDKTKLSRRVRALPEALLALVEDAGAGARVADIVLVPQQAYLAVRAASGETLSAQHTVVCRLKKAAPSLVVRPLPIVDGRPLDNRGLVIDDAFGEAFIVDGDNTYGGRIVTNPSGGLLSKGHPLGATGLAQCYELVSQLRGQAEQRQVEGARLALQHNLGLGGACVVTLYQKV